MPSSGSWVDLIQPRKESVKPPKMKPKEKHKVRETKGQKKTEESTWECEIMSVL